MTERRSGLFVAVVDDDQGVLQSIDRLLESAGYTAVLFASPRELLESDCLPLLDCLISDMEMPGMKGIELLRLIRADHPELPIVLITGYFDALKEVESLAGDNPVCLIKPFRGPELLAAIGGCIRKFRGQSAP